MPLTKLQFHILGLLAASRSPDSYIAGGSAINRDGPRFSSDIDIFHDCDERLAAIAAADAATIKAARLDLSWLRSRGSERTALIAGLDEHTQLEWVADSDFRFPPAIRFSGMSSILSILRRTRLRPRRTDGCHAISSIW